MERRVRRYPIVINFLNAEGVTGSKIHRRLSNVHGAGNVLNLRHIYKWIKRFNTGQSNTHKEHTVVIDGIIFFNYF